MAAKNSSKPKLSAVPDTDAWNDQAVLDSNHLIGNDPEETMMNCTCVLELLAEFRVLQFSAPSEPYSDVELGKGMVLRVVIDALRKQVAAIEAKAKTREAANG